MDTEFKKLNLFSPSALARNKTILISLTVILILALAGAGYLYYEYQKTKSELKKVKSGATVTQTAPADDKVKSLIAEVSKVARLPANEIPSLATITDISKLKDQEFFRDAKNGDILLVYNASGKAILYDPKEKKIINVTTLSTTPSFNQQFKIVIRNGTATPQLAGKLEEELKKALGVANVIAKENAQKETYEKTIIVVLNEAAKEFAQNLSKLINAEIAEMPTGENRPEGADVLIIIGKDRSK